MHIFEVCDIYTSFSTPRAKGVRSFFAPKTAPAEAYSEKGVGVFLKKTGTLLKKTPCMGVPDMVKGRMYTPTASQYEGTVATSCFQLAVI